jgi:excisionase family DNA binding protein
MQSEPAPNNGPVLLLDRRQAAEALSISVSLIDLLVKRGDLVPCRIGRSVRFSMETLRGFVRQREQPLKIVE